MHSTQRVRICENGDERPRGHHFEQRDMMLTNCRQAMLSAWVRSVKRKADNWQTLGEVEYSVDPCRTRFRSKLVLFGKEIARRSNQAFLLGMEVAFMLPREASFSDAWSICRRYQIDWICYLGEMIRTVIEDKLWGRCCLHNTLRVVWIKGS